MPGVQVGQLRNTWAWDGTDWAALHPDEQPRHIRYAQMVFDAAHGYLLEFSGTGQDEASSEPGRLLQATGSADRKELSTRRAL